MDVFIQSISFGPFVLYGTKVGEIYGQNLQQFKLENYRRWALNVLGLLEQELDPLDIWAKRSHELAMQFWPSLRLNDIHKDWVERRQRISSDWIRSFRPLLQPTRLFLGFRLRLSRGPRPQVDRGGLLNYDVDGFEIESHVLQEGRRETRHGMTRCQKSSNRINGSPARRTVGSLAVRVPPTLDLCSECVEKSDVRNPAGGSLP